MDDIRRIKKEVNQLILEQKKDKKVSIKKLIRTIQLNADVMKENRKKIIQKLARKIYLKKEVQNIIKEVISLCQEVYKHAKVDEEQRTVFIDGYIDKNNNPVSLTAFIVFMSLIYLDIKSIFYFTDRIRQTSDDTQKRADEKSLNKYIMDLKNIINNLKKHRVNVWTIK